MGHFSENLDLRWLKTSGGRLYWELLSQLIYVADSGEVFIIPMGFKTDGATVPRIFWPIFPPMWKYSKAAVLHDYLIVSKIKTFPEANTYFREAMISLEVNSTQLWFMYQAVCLWYWFRTNVLKKT